MCQTLKGHTSSLPRLASSWNTLWPLGWRSQNKEPRPVQVRGADRQGYIHFSKPRVLRKDDHPWLEERAHPECLASYTVGSEIPGHLMDTIWSQVLLPSLSQNHSAQGMGDLGGHLDPQKFTLLPHRNISASLPYSHLCFRGHRSGCKYG